MIVTYELSFRPCTWFYYDSVLYRTVKGLPVMGMGRLYASNFIQHPTGKNCQKPSSTVFIHVFSPWSIASMGEYICTCSTWQSWNGSMWGMCVSVEGSRMAYVHVQNQGAWLCSAHWAKELLRKMSKLIFLHCEVNFVFFFFPFKICFRYLKFPPAPKTALTRGMNFTRPLKLSWNQD